MPFTRAGIDLAGTWPAMIVLALVASRAASASFVARQ
jgi:hypothetical protein